MSNSLRTKIKLDSPNLQTVFPEGTLTTNEAEKLAEITVDFYNAIEAAAVNAKRQIAEIYCAEPTPEQSARQSKTPATEQEMKLNILKFNPQQGAKIGAFEVAYKENNLAENWSHAFDILRSSNATIKNRYQGEGYQYSYWLYGEDRIYRQNLKQKS